MILLINTPIYVGTVRDVNDCICNGECNALRPGAYCNRDREFKRGKVGSTKE